MFFHSIYTHKLRRKHTHNKHRCLSIHIFVIYMCVCWFLLNLLTYATTFLCFLLSRFPSHWLSLFLMSFLLVFYHYPSRVFFLSLVYLLSSSFDICVWVYVYICMCVCWAQFFTCFVSSTSFLPLFCLFSASFLPLSSTFFLTSDTFSIRVHLSVQEYVWTNTLLNTLFDFFTVVIFPSHLCTYYNHSHHSLFPLPT